ncbi:MAG: fibronectin type III domain-containing protein, partial [Verrucomicrobia bacterium]|nr:fibronectin type III domain-containing protein [Verrucomicrobiota bacterium]
ATYITDKTITGGRVNTFKALTGLFAPTGFTAAPMGRLATLNWDDTNLVESGYEIWRSSSMTGAFYLVETVVANTTTYATGPLAKGHYRFFVRAINAHGAPVDSAIATVRIK